MIRLRIILLFLTTCFLCLHSTNVILGDMNDKVSTFSFALLPTIIIDKQDQVLYVCSQQEVLSATSKAYGVSALYQKKKVFSVDQQIFIPLLTPQAIESSTIIENPLWGAGFSTLGFSHMANPVNKLFPNVGTMSSIMKHRENLNNQY